MQSQVCVYTLVYHTCAFMQPWSHSRHITLSLCFNWLVDSSSVLKWPPHYFLKFCYPKYDSGSPGSLLELQNQRSHPRHIELESAFNRTSDLLHVKVWEHCSRKCLYFLVHSLNMINWVEWQAHQNCFEAGQVDQLVRYAKVADSVLGEGTYRNQPINA